jgi:HlyD family secretion protein
MSLRSITSRRFLVVAVLLVTVVFVTVMALRGKKVAGVTVERRDLLQTVVTTGRVTSLARVEVGSQILGSVTAVRAEAGDRVKAGQVLLQLRDDEVRATLEQSLAVVRENEERLKQITTIDSPVSQQRVGEAEANLRQAAASYERVRKLYDSGIISRADFDEALRVKDVATGLVERERLQRSNSRPQGSDVRLAEARLAQARAAVAGMRERLARTVITAPGDGTVTSRKVEVGDVVQPGVPLLVLSQHGRTRITAQIDEKNLGLLQVGQTAVGSADAYPDKSFSARLATVVPAVDPLRGTVEIRCDVAEPPSYLVPDMTISLEIEVARHAKVVAVPSEAIRDISTTPWVLAVRNGRAERQNITLGIRGSGASEVKSGLKEGDTVLPGSSKLKIGSRISLQRIAGEKHNAH